MNIWRNPSDGDVRLHAPDNKDGWEEVPFEALKPSERIFVTIQSDKEDRAKLDAEQRERFDSLSREVDELYARIPKVGASRDESPEKISIARLFRAIRSGDWSKAGLEKEAVEAGKRILASNADVSGGYIVPAEYLASEFVENIYNKTAVMQAGARRLSGLKGSPIQIPKMTSGCTTYWVGENASITASDQAFGLITMQPKKLAAVTKVSNELLFQSTPAVESIVRDDLARSIGVELDRVALYGDGASGEPVGLIKTSGVGDIAAAAAISVDYMWDLVYKVEEAELSADGGAFISSHKQWNELRQAGDAAGYPKFYMGAGYDVQKACNGYPVYTDGNCAAADVFFGVWRELLIGEWGGIMFAASDSASDGTNYAFTQDQTWIRATMLVDVAVRQPGAFAFNDNFT